MSIVTYKQTVETVQAACNAHIAIQSFAEGPISYLDSNSQNIRYPFVFLRPLSSPGLSGNVRTLNFEMYSLDVPKLDDPGALTVKTNTELFLYDVLGYLRYGPELTTQDALDTMDFALTSITPVNEAFNDRAFGWVANVSITSEGVYNYCNFPD